jgi:hypothetical protein
MPREDRLSRRGRFDDDEDEDRPRRRKSGGGGGKTALIVLAVVGCVLLLCGGAVGGALWYAYRTAKKVVANITGEGPPGKNVAYKARLSIRDGRLLRVFVPTGNARMGLVQCETNLDTPAKRLDRFDAAGGKLLDTTDLGVLYPGPWSPTIYDVSPDGTVIAFGGSLNKLSVYSIAQRQVVVNGWEIKYGWQTPWNRVDQIEASWVAFLDNNRLLAIYADGAVDVWSTQTRQRTPLALHLRNRENFTPHWLQPKMHNPASPRNFALSHSRRQLAYWNGDGYYLTDTTTGQRGQTGALGLPAGHTVTEVRATAYSPDDTQLLCQLAVSVPGNNTEHLLVRFDASTGQKSAQHTIPVGGGFSGLSAGDGLRWWGKGHVLLLSGDRTGHLMNVSTGQYVCKVTAEGWGVSIGPNSPDGRLWLANIEAFLRGGALIAVDLPDDVAEIEARGPNQPGIAPELVISPNGVKRK